MAVWALNDTKAIEAIKASNAIISAKIVVFISFFALHFFPLSLATYDLLGVDMIPWPLIARSV